jgi:hypothetical protein
MYTTLREKSLALGRSNNEQQQKQLIQIPKFDHLFKLFVVPNLINAVCKVSRHKRSIAG